MARKFRSGASKCLFPAAYAGATVNRSPVTNKGGNGGGVPPLPIPNREVKPAIADGTARKGGRVGRRRP